MLRLVLLVGAFLAFACAAQARPPHLVRVVVVMRHGLRPPTRPNSAIAQYAAQPWPQWPVAPGELTPHGAEVVRLMGETLRHRLVDDGLIARAGCADASQVRVWADGADQRTRKTGEVLASALEPGCGLEAGWAPPQPRDPIFSGSDAGACRADPEQTRASFAAAAAAVDRRQAPDLAAATERLQGILAPQACEGGAGTCFGDQSGGPNGAAPIPFPATAALAEDLYLEYADGKPMSEVGWGRASPADIREVMRIHEAAFQAIRADAYLDVRRGAPMARLILAALAGDPVAIEPRSAQAPRVLALAGHDSNLVWMGALFGLDWTLPGQPEAMAPAATLAFELWSDGGRPYVRPVIYYETMDQMRTLSPPRAERLVLRFEDCASGPEGSCPLATVRARVLALIPTGCGDAAAVTEP